MARAIVKLGQLNHDGVLYLVGDEVELDEESCACLVADGIVSIKAAPKAKAKAKVPAKASK